MIPLEVEDGVLVVPKDGSGVVDVLKSHKSLRKKGGKGCCIDPIITIPRGDMSAFSHCCFTLSLEWWPDQILVL